MRVTWPVLLIAVLGLGGCGRQLPPDQARSLLRSVQTARRTLAVEGKLSTAISVQGQTLKAEAETQRGAGAIHLKYVTGRFAGWQIVEQDGLVWRVDPQGKPGPSPIAPEAGLGLPLEANLQVRYTWPVHVAGRRAYRYVIRPPGRSRARLVLAVDAETSYPLRLERYNSSGSLMSETVYREIKYNVVPPARVKPPEVAQRPGDRAGAAARLARQSTEGDLERLLGGPLLKPTYLPAGFGLRGYYAHRTRRGQAAEMRYADGVRTLSVVQFTRPNRQRGLLPGRQQRPGGEQGGPRRPNWRERRGQAPAGGQQTPGAGPGRWWQRSRPGQPQGPEQSPGQGLGSGGPRRGPLGRNFVREPRGTRMVIIAGDVPPEELRKVLQSVPYPAGQRPTTAL